MKRDLKISAIARQLLTLTLVTGLALPPPALAAPVVLATAPLTTSTTSTVKPNVMFILDDSGSMGWNYLPDWADDTDPSSGGLRYTNVPALFRNSGFNGVAYNPAITYTPPVLYNADGTLNTTTYPNIGSPWTSVKNDAYGKVSTSSTNLVTSFPDVEWCTSTAYTNCLRNDNLICNSSTLPCTVGGVSYPVSRSKLSTGTGNVATGTPGSATAVARTFGPFYYTIVPGEFCDAQNLKNCQLTQTATFSYPAVLRWCNSSAASTSATPAAGTCQGINNTTFKYPRYPTKFFSPAVAASPYVPEVPAAPATAPTPGTLKLTAVAQNKSISLKCGATNFGKSGSWTSSNSGTASTRLNSLYTDIHGTTVNGYGTTCVKSPNTTAPTLLTCTITAPAGASACSGGFTVDSDITKTTNTGPAGGTNAVVGSPAIPANAGQPIIYYGSFIRTDIVSGNNSYPYPGTTAKATTRTDCDATTCTYAEEMTNFANWWTYYQTRMQSMKTSVSRAFKTLDNRFRVGFTTISDTAATNGTKFLGNGTFELAHKNSWFTKLFAQDASTYTPLRGALSKAGRYYGKKISGQVDPVQYSCQQNFAIMSTDGYWNTDDETSTYKNLTLTGATLGNMDASPVARPMYEGPTATSGSLADIAKYYYDTDLRTSTLGNCTGGASSDFPTGNPDVCTNNVFVSASDNNVKQHMTTFTMGLGIDGTLNYTADYADATSGDYYNLKNGLGTPTLNWPDPITKTAGERIDDLWHAAVNGQGSYFSAKDPDSIITGFNKALSSITAKLGAAAAAATSTLNPVDGNNFAYVASYTTNVWKGNLEARSINTSTGVVSETATWCVENITEQTCAAPGTVVANTSGSSTTYNCVVTGSTAGTCVSPGVFDTATSECRTEIHNACTGAMATKVGTVTDTRTIYAAPAGSLTVLTGQNLVPFDAAYATANQVNFSAAHISTLNQWGTLTGPDTVPGTQQYKAQGVNLINYLRGQNGFEDRAANDSANRLYRTREAVLGDALESQPAFIGPPVFSYPYPGYGDFKTAKASREGTVYMGTNDGMMHAFAASNGEERWAFVPSMVIPNMWKLASTSYSSNHANFVNGSPITSDICISGCSDSATAVWKTILVGGLNGGGRGYYALNIDNPDLPVLLWEFTPASDSDLGYSFGVPIVTKKADGTWVVLITSGYDNGTSSADPVTPTTDPVTFVPNSPAGSGKGFLYVLNAATGAVISKISTNVGSATTPSGLAKIAGWNNVPVGNEVGYVYGGDLLGNLWRFNINDTATAAVVGTGSVMKLAELYSDTAGASPQPVTTTPILGKVAGKRVIFVGTGKYLETSDLTTTQVQTQYAIKDDDASTTLVNPRNTLTQQTLTNNTDGTATRLASSNEVNFSSDPGWYIDFPDSKERVNIDSKLVLGTLLIPTIVPSSTVCSPGGYGWINFVNYETGGAVDHTALASKITNSPIVGINVLYIQGQPIVEVVTSTNPTPEIVPGIPFAASAGGFVGKRVTWRELIQ